MSTNPAVSCISLGLFILDTFEWRDPNSNEVTKHEESIIGGGGTYAILGSRCWLTASRLRLIVDRGSDWESSVQKRLEAFGPEMWMFRDNPGQPTTRALNLYTGEHRDFKYLTPRRRLEPVDVPADIRSATHLHFVCSPTRAIEIHSQLQGGSWQPTLVYEPIPDRCIAEELPSLRQVLPHVAVFSPNHEEAHAFYGTSAEEANAQGRAGIERVAQRFFDEGALDLVVIRSGALGAYAIRRGQSRGKWTEAYHRYGSSMVKDPTGAGNAFMGGLMAGLSQDASDIETAVQMGSISSSFVIEQFSLPTLSLADDGKTELWNGVNPADRLAEMRARPPLHVSGGLTNA